MTQRIIVITNDLTSARAAAMVAEMEGAVVINLSREVRLASEECNIEVSELADRFLSVFPDVTAEKLGLYIEQEVLYRASVSTKPSDISYTAAANAAIDELLSIRFGDYGIPKSAFVPMDFDNVPKNSKKPEKFLRENHRITKVRRHK